MLTWITAYWLTLTRYRSYRPQAVTLAVLHKWIAQFPRRTRTSILKLFNGVTYFTEKETEQMLVRLNKLILSDLAEDDISPENIIYVSLDTTGSSSHVTLSLLRDRANLERKNSKLIDSKDTRSLSEVTNTLETGAIVYVDDFCGTGNQFRKNRDLVAPYIIGNFAEFFLVPCICEEAVETLEEAGVTPIWEYLHTKKERPLHAECGVLEADIKEELVKLAEQIHPHAGLGFRKLATMIVFYRNAPNTMPLLFRGSLKQSPRIGVFPRSDDLPF